MEPRSPKGADLRERRWFALHNGVPDDAGSGGEFSVSGLGHSVDDRELWSFVADAASYTPVDRYVPVRAAAERSPVQRVWRRAVALHSEVVGRAHVTTVSLAWLGCTPPTATTSSG